MRTRPAAFGFLARVDRCGREGGYRIHHPEADRFRLNHVALWPENPSHLLLSLKIRISRPDSDRRGLWEEQLAGPAPLAILASQVPLEIARGCVPQGLRDPPGPFYLFEGQAALSANALPRSGQIFTSEAGPVSARWTGNLFGLLLLGEIAA